MPNLWHATLNPASPRYKDWLEILGTDRVELLHPKTIQTKLGEEEAEVYVLDWLNLEGEASQRLLDFLARKFNAEKAVIEKNLDEDGVFPIRAQDVIVSFDLRAFM
jgi:hypothetical protein